MVTRSSARVDERRRGSPAPSPPSRIARRAAQVAARRAACRRAAPPRTTRTPRARAPADGVGERLRGGDRQPERAAHRAAQRLPAERIRRALAGDDARSRRRPPRRGRSRRRCRDPARSLSISDERPAVRAKTCVDAWPAAARAIATTPDGVRDRADRGEHRIGDGDASRLAARAAPAPASAPSAAVRRAPSANAATSSRDAERERLLDEMLAVEQHRARRLAVASRRSRKRFTSGFCRLAMRSMKAASIVARTLQLPISDAVVSATIPR